MLRGTTAVIQSDYTSLQSDYSSPDRVIAASGRSDGEANADGNRDALREIGAGRDTRVDARAERSDGDANSWGVLSVAATAARRCMGREPMLMWSIPPPRPSPSNRCPAERHAAATLTRALLQAAVQMCRTLQNSPVNRMVRPSRDGMPGTLSSGSRRGVSSRTTRTSPKLRGVLRGAAPDLLTACRWLTTREPNDQDRALATSSSTGLRGPPRAGSFGALPS